MKKILLIFVIFFLVLSTTIIKNSTKKIDDQIYTVNENLRSLDIELGDILLEFNYLSSAEKILEYQSLYFESDLDKTDIKKIKTIQIIDKKLLIEDLIKSEKE
jgi:cell division protein FtsL